MKTATLYHNNRCGKSRAALQALQEKGYQVAIRYYLEQPLSQKELIALVKKLKLPAAAIIRTKEPLFKALGDTKAYQEQDWIMALLQYPILLERPIIELATKAWIARSAEALSIL
jgi:arsenate reductase (glutaredoxin)